MIRAQRIFSIPAIMQMRFLSPQAAAVSWWLSGGISAGNCYAAYAAKGAASLAASYSNLNNPGTNDAGVGVAPTWGAATGWVFNGSTQYLTTAFLPEADQSQTVILRFSNLTSSGALTGTRGFGSGDIFAVRGSQGSNAVRYRHGAAAVDSSPQHTVGTLCIAGNQGYRDGSADGAALAGWGGAAGAYPMYIGGYNNGTGMSLPDSVYIQAIAIYDTTLTAPQVLAVSNAMAAL